MKKVVQLDWIRLIGGMKELDFFCNEMIGQTNNDGKAGSKTADVYVRIAAVDRGRGGAQQNWETEQLPKQLS